MTNLQLVDTLDGGHFVFRRNDYPLDEGIYTELYCAFFATKNNWWADKAFDVQSHSLNSRTEKALKTSNFNNDASLTLIKKAVTDDLDRFKIKNPEIEIQRVALVVYGAKALMILVEITGNSQTFDFIYKKTAESLENIKYEIYDI